MRTLTCAVAVCLAFAQQAPVLPKPDLSSPEAAVRSFLMLFESGEVQQSRLCVVGAAPDAAYAVVEKDMKAHPPPARLRPVIDTVTVTTAGETATAVVKYARVENQPPLQDETVTLRKVNGDWKVVPLTDAEVQKASSFARGTDLPRPVGMIAWLLTNPKVFEQARDQARAVSCLSNVKQIALGTLMLVQDFDEKFAIRADSFKSRVMPYIKNDAVFHCPSDAAGAVSYSFNPKLQGVALAKLQSPAATVMIYEGHGTKLDFRHDGRASVAFADGHAKLVSQQEAASLRWKP